MNLFRYWAVEDRVAQDPKGEKVHLRAWGGDNLSPDGARMAARAKMTGWLGKLRLSADAFFDATGYPYADRALREEVLEGEFDPIEPEHWLWAITRNRYGAEVLNMASLAILDLDRRPRGVWGWLSTLGMGRERLNRRVLRRVTTWLAVSPEVSMRLYETPNGFRALLLHQPFDPKGHDVQKLMREVGTDRLYARLCAVQGSFRARLTAKPWRAGWPRARWLPLLPGQTRSADDERWLAGYRAKAEEFAACRFLSHLGQPAPNDATLARWVALHDERSGALSSKPLA